MGWVGTWSELEYTLKMFNCDLNAEGKLCVDGTIVSYMGGGQEMVVGDDAVYYVGGQARSVVMALKATSYGTHVTVI